MYFSPTHPNSPQQLSKARSTILDMNSLVTCNVPELLSLSKERIKKTDSDRMSVDSSRGLGEPSIDNMKLGEAKKFELAVLHVDINDFKNKTQNLSNEEYLRLVTTYLTEMTRIINENNGWVDRYVGDQVTALFGTNHNCNCCNPLESIRCALNMQTVVKYSMNEFLLSIGLPQLTCSIGIDYGDIWVAKVGIRGSNEFTLVGNTVNIAANLVDIAPAARIFIGQNLHHRLPEEQQKLCYAQTGYSWPWVNLPTNSTYKYYLFNGIWTGYPL